MFTSALSPMMSFELFFFEEIFFVIILLSDAQRKFSEAFYFAIFRAGLMLLMLF